MVRFCQISITPFYISYTVNIKINSERRVEGGVSVGDYWLHVVAGKAEPLGG